MIKQTKLNVSTATTPDSLETAVKREAPKSADAAFPSSIAFDNELTQAIDVNDRSMDLSKSYYGLSTEPFEKEKADILMAPIEPNDVEIKPGISVFLLYFLNF